MYGHIEERRPKTKRREVQQSKCNGRWQKGSGGAAGTVKRGNDEPWGKGHFHTHCELYLERESGRT